MLPRFPAFINHFVKLETIFYKTLHLFREHLYKIIKYFFLGELFTPNFINLAKNKAENHPHGIGIIRIGPPMIGMNIVHLQPKNVSTFQMRHMLKTISELKNSSARCPYDIRHLTKSSFYLSMPDKEAYPLRNKTTPFFKIKYFEKQLPLTLMNLFKELEENKNHTSTVKYGIVQNHILRLFTQSLYGFELSQPVKDVLKRLPPSLPYFIFSTWIQYIIPQFHRDKTAFNFAIKIFLREQLKKINVKEEKNLFQKIVFSKLPKKNIPLTDKNIEKLIDDPEIRLCITGLLATHNIQYAIIAGLNYLYQDNALLKKIHEENPHSIEHMANKNKSPFLHAFFLETLRLSPPMPYIFRYIDRRLTIENISIPGRSVIIFDLVDTLKLLYNTAKYPANQFRPERFLNDAGALHQQAILHQDMLVFFGMGARRCPADTLSLFLFKYFMLSFAQRIRLFNNNTIEFIPVSREEKQVSSAPAMKIACTSKTNLFTSATLSSSVHDKEYEHANSTDLTSWGLR